MSSHSGSQPNGSPPADSFLPSDNGAEHQSDSDSDYAATPGNALPTLAPNAMDFEQDSDTDFSQASTIAQPINGYGTTTVSLVGMNLNFNGFSGPPPGDAVEFDHVLMNADEDEEDDAAMPSGSSIGGFSSPLNNRTSFMAPPIRIRQSMPPTLPINTRPFHTPFNQPISTQPPEANTVPAALVLRNPLPANAEPTGDDHSRHSSPATGQNPPTQTEREKIDFSDAPVHMTQDELMAARHLQAHVIDSYGVADDSGRNLMAIIGNDPIPRTRCNIQIRRGRTGGSAYTDFPEPTTEIPAGTSLDDICSFYPNHVWGTGLRLFMHEQSKPAHMYTKLPDKFKPKDQKDRPHNYLQQAFGREQDHILKERKGIKRVAIARPRQAGYKTAKKTVLSGRVEKTYRTSTNQTILPATPQFRGFSDQSSQYQSSPTMMASTRTAATSSASIPAMMTSSGYHNATPTSSAANNDGAGAGPGAVTDAGDGAGAGLDAGSGPGADRPYASPRGLQNLVAEELQHHTELTRDIVAADPRFAGRDPVQMEQYIRQVRHERLRQDFAQDNNMTGVLVNQIDMINQVLATNPRPDNELTTIYDIDQDDLVARGLNWYLAILQNITRNLRHNRANARALASAATGRDVTTRYATEAGL
jgi:hypothetical protein